MVDPPRNEKDLFLRTAFAELGPFAEQERKATELRGDGWTVEGGIYLEALNPYGVSEADDELKSEEQLKSIMVGALVYAKGKEDPLLSLAVDARDRLVAEMGRNQETEKQLCSELSRAALEQFELSRIVPGSRLRQASKEISRIISGPIFRDKVEPRRETTAPAEVASLVA